MVRNLFSTFRARQRRKSLVAEIKTLGFRVTDSLGKDIQGDKSNSSGYFLWTEKGEAVNKNGGYGRLRDAHRAALEFSRHSKA